MVFSYYHRWGERMASIISKADILTQSLVQKQESFHTDNPVEALARSLNDKGFVDMEFITAATRLTEPDAIQALGNHIYLNPANERWETDDQLLSGNVIIKLSSAKDYVDQHPENVQFRKSLEALEKIQPAYFKLWFMFTESFF